MSESNSEKNEDELTRSAKEFAESLVKLVGVTGKTLLKGIEETFPELSKSAQQILSDLDRSVSDLFRSLDKATVSEQRELLSAYRKMLLVQLNKIEERLKRLDEQTNK